MRAPSNTVSSNLAYWKDWRTHPGRLLFFFQEDCFMQNYTPEDWHTQSPYGLQQQPTYCSPQQQPTTTHTETILPPPSLPR